MKPSSTAEQSKNLEFSQPKRPALLMIMILILVVLGSGLMFSSIAPIFFASPYFNAIILAVFALGVFTCFFQLISIAGSVSWIEGFALDRSGHEFSRPPRLLVPLASLLKDSRSRLALNSTSARSILDSVATRLDESRDITRYIINLLIFLGLLGTFYGLATTVPAVVETIRSLAPNEGQTAIQVFEGLMEGLEKQLGGMGTAFASSLLGLAGSLVVGLLEIFAGHGQNRFYMELEEWISSFTRVGLASGEGDQENTSTNVMTHLFEETNRQIETLQQISLAAENQRQITDDNVMNLMKMIEKIADAGTSSPSANIAQSALNRQTLDLLSESQVELVTIMKGKFEDNQSVDTEMKSRLRNIDLQLSRIHEELNAGRQDTISELRTDLANLSTAILELAEAKTKYRK